MQARARGTRDLSPQGTPLAVHGRAEQAGGLVHVQSLCVGLEARRLDRS